MKLAGPLAWLALLSAACSSETGSNTAHQEPAGGSAQAGTGGAGSGASGSSTTAGASQANGGAGAGTSPVANGGSMAGAGAASGGGGAGGTSAGAGAASGGAGAGGAPGGGSGAGCAQAGTALFCEDFESSAAGPVTAGKGWSPVSTNGTLTIDSTHAQGKNALHVQTQGNGKAYIKVSPFAPPQNTFFGRMRVWVTAFPSAPDYAHFTMVEATGTEPGSIRPIGGQNIPGKGDLWGVGSDGGPTGDWTNWKESAPAEAGKWLCLEWSMAAADNQIQVWIDGTAKPELTVNTKSHGGSADNFVLPKFDSIWFGWWLYQSGSTPAQFDLWLDDIALAPQRLGC